MWYMICDTESYKFVAEWLFQTFMKEGMGVPLLMEPNFGDYSCQVRDL